MFWGCEEEKREKECVKKTEELKNNTIFSFFFSLSLSLCRVITRVSSILKEIVDLADDLVFILVFVYSPFSPSRRSTEATVETTATHTPSPLLLVPQSPRVRRRRSRSFSSQNRRFSTYLFLPSHHSQRRGGGRRQGGERGGRGGRVGKGSGSVGCS